MLGKLFWIALGAAGAVYVVRRVSKTAHSFTPAGLSENVGNLAGELRSFGDSVLNAMAEREVELRDALLSGPTPDEQASR